MRLTFTARIDGKRTLRQIGAAEPVFAAILCFSLMAVPQVHRAGGRRHRGA